MARCMAPRDGPIPAGKYRHVSHLKRPCVIGLHYLSHSEILGLLLIHEDPTPLIMSWDLLNTFPSIPGFPPSDHSKAIVGCEDAF